MKTLTGTLGLALAAVIASCNMNNDLASPNLAKQVEGTYNGTLTSVVSKNEISATAEIKSTSDYSIQVHCYGAKFDTTFVLNLYSDGNMMEVCSTGKDFEQQYGHAMTPNNTMMSSNQMMGNQMMGSQMMGNYMSWQQHMSTEHKSTDTHNGYFDMKAKAFHYAFILSGGANEIDFQGLR